PPDVDERSLHRRQHVLHPAEVDVAHDGALPGRGDEVLDEHTVLQHTDLRGALTFACLLAHHHGAFHRFAASQELGFGQDRRAAAACLPAVPTALPLGLQPRGPAHAAHLVLGRLGRTRLVVRAFRNCVVTGAPPTAAPATAPGRTLGLVTVGVCAALVRRRVLAACGPFAAGGVGAAVVGLLVGAAVVLLVGFLVVVLGAAGSVLGALLIGLGTLLRLGLAGL